MRCFLFVLLLFVVDTSARSLTFFGWPWFIPSVPEKKRAEYLPSADIEPIPVPEAPGSVNWFSPSNKKYHSAILVAGSRGFYNYRHQADVCHAYRILRERGLPNDNIITFLFDDIAFHSYNPYRGQLFNSPGGRDVYPGCVKDYSGYDVNKKNVLAVLTGDAEAMKGIGSERVLKKDPNQKIFMFYSDHGSVGSIGMPTGSPLYAIEFKKAIDQMVKEKFFKEFVFYLESCESGSMFRGMGFEKYPEVLMVSASGAFESSYATYCPTWFDNKQTPDASDIGACLGDLFSVSWMEYTESHDIASELVSDQLTYVKNRTAADDYDLGSHMMIYGGGNATMQNEVVGNFLSFFNIPDGLRLRDQVDVPVPETEEKLEGKKKEGDRKLPKVKHSLKTMKQRDADLQFLMDRVMRNTFENKDKAMLELEQTIAERRKADIAIRSIVRVLLETGELSSQNSLEDYVERQLQEDQDQPVVKDWECLIQFGNIWEDFCGRMTDYSRQYTRTFANLCNQQISAQKFFEAAKTTCGRSTASTLMVS